MSFILKLITYVAAKPCAKQCRVSHDSREYGCHCEGQPVAAAQPCAQQCRGHGGAHAAYQLSVEGSHTVTHQSIISAQHLTLTCEHIRSS